MIKRLLLSLRKSKLGQMIHLAHTSFFAQPLDYVGQPRPVQAKFRSIATLPLLPAGLWAAANLSLIEWVASRQLMAGGPAHPELSQRLHTVQSVTGKGAFALMFALVYGVTLLRWCKQRGVAWLMGQLKRPVPTLPWSYYLINTTAAAVWFSLFAYAITWCIWKSDGNVRQYLDQLVAQSPLVFAGTMLAIGFARNAHANRSVRGMRAFYGSNYWAVFWVDVTLVAVLFIIFLVSTPLLLR